MTQSEVSQHATENGLSVPAESADPQLIVHLPDDELPQSPLDGIDPEEVNTKYLYRITLNVSNIPLGSSPEDITVGLRFWKRLLEQHAEQTGTNPMDPLYMDVRERLTGESRAALPDIIKGGQLHRVLGSMARLATQFRALQEEARSEAVDDKLSGSPPEPPKAQPVTENDTLPGKAVTKPPLLPQRPIPTLPRLQPKPVYKPRSSKNKATPAPPKSPIAVTLPKSEQALRPFRPELLDEIQLPPELKRLNKYVDLPEPLMKVLALHVGLVELPEVQTPYSNGFLSLVRRRIIQPALEVDKKQKVNGSEGQLSTIDIFLIDQLVPVIYEDAAREELVMFEREPIRGYALRDIAERLDTGVITRHPAVQSGELKQYVSILFGRKLPTLLSLAELKAYSS